MSNKFYDPGQERAAKVTALFATIAPRYDLINDIQSFGLHRYWKQRLLDLTLGRPGSRALDLCCGTGDVAFALAARGMHTVGLDFSEPMLAVARERAQASVHEKGASVRFLKGDAQKIPFPDNSFDVVTISYGLRNLANMELGLREMKRVAKPGGRLLILDFGKPDNFLWRSLYFSYLKRFVPVMGKVFCGDADTHGYILESLKHYAAQRGVAGSMAEMDLAQIRIINLMGGMMSINYGEKKSA